MVYFWDYDINELNKTKEGKMLILERMINNSIYLKDKERINISQVKNIGEDLK